MNGPFHAGEQAIQSRVGVRAMVEAMGRRIVRDHMPEQHTAFYAGLPWLIVGSEDADGQPHATALAGAPGFVHAEDPRRLRVGVAIAGDDPVAADLRVGGRVGVLGIELPTRRRNRANGAVAEIDDRGFTIAIGQTFGNCPKYIQARTWGAAARTAGATIAGTGTDPRWIDLALEADTFFVASRSPEAGADGVDVSHRGGAPGFVRLGADGRLWLPDYAGNQMFMTLGNLIEDPRCGLLFVDFAGGDLLHVEATAAVVWPEEFEEVPVAVPTGAERMLALTPGRWTLRRGRLGLAFGAPVASPFLP